MLAPRVRLRLNRPVTALLAAVIAVGLALALPGTAVAQFAPLAITSGHPPDATTGSPYTFQFTAAGGTPPYTWTLDIMGQDSTYLVDPAYRVNLQIGATTGLVSGTPGITGEIPIYVEVTDADYYRVGVRYDLLIVGQGSPQVITNSPPAGLQDASYSNFRFQSTLAQDLGCDPSLYFVQGAVPPGLTLNLISGDLGNPPATWGTPLTAGDYTFTIMSLRGDDYCGTPPYTDAQTFTVHIAPAASPTSPPGASAWERAAGTPVLPPAPAGWDSFQVRSPSVIKVGSTYHMYYEAEDSTHRSRIGLATSADGRTWTRSAANPVLAPGASGAWDAFEVRYPSVHFDGTTYRMWYWGRNALSDGAEIGLATSSDGVTWT
jgi:hypothetical protein